MAKELLKIDPLEKETDHCCQRGSKPSFFTLPPTQKPVGVSHTTIANLLGYVSGLYGVFFR